MGLITYVFVLFGISLAMYFVGFSSPLFHLMQCNGATTAEACTTYTDAWSQGIINQIFALITSPQFLISIGLAAFVPFLTGGNFSVLYVIPIAILFALTNFLFLPTDFILYEQYQMPPIISLLLLGFMNLWQIGRAHV